MKRLLSLCLLLALALPAPAHFVWLAPHEGDKVRLVFSEDTEPDPAVPIKNIAQTEVMVRMGGKPTPAPKTAADDHYLIALPPGKPAEVGAVCEYGVLAKSGDPFLLSYYAKTLVGSVKAAGLNHPLEIFPVGQSQGTFEVRWQGKPLPGAEIIVDAPQAGAKKMKTDAQGRVQTPVKNGLILLRAKHIEPKEGKRGDKSFKEVRHYATLTMQVGSATAGAATPADPAATKLLADARAARAVWNDFRGFTADVVVNHNGRLVNGALAVDAQGKVQLDMEEGELKTWARKQIASLVNHRLPGAAALQTPCAFIDGPREHPSGVAIRVLNDELHSSYRIRDRQIIEVNRSMGDIRFTITVLENTLNKEKQFLPVAYMVNTWDLKSNQLRSSAAHHDRWQRIGDLDLPEQISVVTATSEGLDVRSLTFSNQRTGSATAGR